MPTLALVTHILSFSSFIALLCIAFIIVTLCVIVIFLCKRVSFKDDYFHKKCNDLTANVPLTSNVVRAKRFTFVTKPFCRRKQELKDAMMTRHLQKIDIGDMMIFA